MLFTKSRKHLGIKPGVGGRKAEAYYQEYI